MPVKATQVLGSLHPCALALPSPCCCGHVGSELVDERSPSLSLCNFALCRSGSSKINLRIPWTSLVLFRNLTPDGELAPDCCMQCALRAWCESRVLCPGFSSTSLCRHTLGSCVPSALSWGILTWERDPAIGHHAIWVGNFMVSGIWRMY